MRVGGRWVVAVVLASALGTQAAGPEERVRVTLDAVGAVLADPQLASAEKEAERQRAVRAVIRESFDFAAMSRTALGPHWEGLAPAQREEFTTLFGDVFEASYNRLVLRFLGPAKTVYGATSVEGARAVVKTTLDRGSDGKLPVDYQLTGRGEDWRIADVVVDGISLASNFRSQFDKTIRSSSYDELVRKLRAKLDRDA